MQAEESAAICSQLEKYVFKYYILEAIVLKTQWG